MIRFNLADYPAGAKYAVGTTGKLQWKWKPVDQAYVDKLNKRWEDVSMPPAVAEPAVTSRKKRKS